MSASDVIALVCSLSAAILVSYLFRLRKIPRVYLTDYMRGLRFVKGSFGGLLGPGGHQPLTRGEHVEVMDMRPAPFVLESIWYRDALQSDSVISIGAELLVDDAYLAAVSLKDRVGDTLPLVRGVLRSVVSRTVVGRNPEARTKLRDDLEATVNDELRPVGMKISRVEITEVFSRGTAPQHIGDALN